MERGFLFPHFLFHIFGRKHPKLCNELLTEGNHRIIPYHFRHFCQTAISPAHDNRGSFTHPYSMNHLYNRQTCFLLNLAQVKYAILETSGNVSALLYPKYEPASAKDAGVQVDDLHLPITLISGGRLLRENLDLLGKSEAWVRESLSAYNCEIRDVFLLTCEPGGKLYLSIREDAT